MLLLFELKKHQTTFYIYMVVLLDNDNIYSQLFRNVFLCSGCKLMQNPCLHRLLRIKDCQGLSCKKGTLYSTPLKALRTFQKRVMKYHKSWKLGRKASKFPFSQYSTATVIINARVPVTTGTDPTQIRRCKQSAMGRKGLIGPSTCCWLIDN